MKTISSSFKHGESIHSRKAFTLIELIVSITILSVILLSVFEIYNNIIQLNKRLEVMRVVQENVRNITEQIANDIREKGIDFNYYTSLTEINNYTGSGNTILAINGNTTYYPMKDSLSGPVICSAMNLKNPSTHCYIGRKDSTGFKKISDDRVRIENIRFFISGDPSTSITNLSQEGKVAIVLSIMIENKVGISSEIAKNSRMLIQTTISEKAYKEN